MVDLPGGERRTDLAGLLCAVGRHGPAALMLVLLSAAAALLVYRAVRSRRARAAAWTGKPPGRQPIPVPEEAEEGGQAAAATVEDGAAPIEPPDDKAGPREFLDDDAEPRESPDNSAELREFPDEDAEPADDWILVNHQGHSAALFSEEELDDQRYDRLKGNGRKRSFTTSVTMCKSASEDEGDEGSLFTDVNLEPEFVEVSSDLESDPGQSSGFSGATETPIRLETDDAVVSGCSVVGPQSAPRRQPPVEQANQAPCGDMLGQTVEERHSREGDQFCEQITVGVVVVVEEVIEQTVEKEEEHVGTQTEAALEAVTPSLDSHNSPLEATASTLDDPGEAPVSMETLTAMVKAPTEAPLETSISMLEAPACGLASPVSTLDPSVFTRQAPTVTPEAPASMPEAQPEPREAVTAAIEGPASAPETPAVTLEAPAPMLEAPTAALEEPTSVLDAPAVALEAPAPTLEAPTCALEATASTLGASTEAPNAPTSAPQVPTSTFEAPGATLEAPMEPPAAVLEAPTSMPEALTAALEDPAATLEAPTEALAAASQAPPVCSVTENVAVTFCVHYLTRSPAQTLAVTGNQRELGNWTGFVPLERYEDGIWSRAVGLPARCRVEWKFVLLEEGGVCRWEECGNRRLDTGAGDHLRLHEWWGVR